MARVSVIIPTYDRREMVQEAIDSVLAQTYTDYEIIVVDDGSTDGTGEALQARYGNRICYVWQENQGESVARNKGIDLAQGQYIAFLDSDDLWLPEKLERQVSFLEANPGVGMVFSSARRIDAEGNRICDGEHVRRITSEDLTLENLCFDCPITAPSTVVVAKSVLDASGRFDPTMRYGEDEDLWLRVRLLTEIGFLPESLACIRLHRESQSYFPSSQQNPQRLRAYLYAREKVFAAWAQAPQDLPGRSIGWQYAKGALREAVVGDKQAAWACLKEVAVHDASLFNNYRRFGSAIAGQAALLYEREDSDHLTSALAFVRSVLAAVAEMGYYDRTFARKTMAISYGSLGFTAHRKEDRKATRYCFVRALVLDPSLARNKGILSLLFEAVFGKKASVARKSVWSRLGRRRPRLEVLGWSLRSTLCLLSGGLF